MPTLALLDGHSLAYRAFFALPEDLATTSGQVTNAAYGFTRMLIKLLGDHHPDALAVAWDISRQTFRKEQYSEYKAQRTSAPDTFKSQLPLIREVLDALSIRQLQMEGFEADDVIASVARQARDVGWDVLVVTGDRDAFQLIDDQITVLYTRRGITDVVRADETFVTERYGIRPDQYVEYAAMRGDTSDNLPGVPGVGEKTAAKLLNAYGSLKGVFAAVEDQSPKLRENLVANEEQVMLNRQLMALVDNLDMGVQVPELARGEWDRSSAKDLFVSLEFHSLWEDLLAVQPDADEAVTELLDVEGVIASTEATVSALASDRMVIDWIDEGGFTGLAILSGEAEVALVALDDLEPLREHLDNPGVAKIVHHGKPLVKQLFEAGFRVRGLGFDTALAAYVVNPATRAYDLAEVAFKFLNMELESPDDSDLGDSGQGSFDFSEGPNLGAAARRVVAIDRLSAQLATELEDRDELELFTDVELPLIVTLAHMEEAGIKIDRPYLEDLGLRLREELAVLEAKIHELNGEPFNVNSTDQLRVVLFERLGLPISKKTSTGKPSTDASVLEKLDHPLVDHLLKYRELEKLRSTYVDGYLPLIKTDGRIHTTFNQMAAATGRLSSEEPNLQNIPVRSESGMTIRRAFVPQAGWTFVVADYSQIELRVLAHMSGDAGLLEAFREGQDVHTATASRVFEVEPELITPEMRRRAKVINFGLLYGMEAFGLAQRLDIGRDEAQEHMNAYFAQFPDVKAFMDGLVTQARRTGYTATMFGRRRYLPELKSDNFRIRQMGERMALNAPVQGTAADIIKMAMMALEAELIEREMESTMLLQIHDELILEAPQAELLTTIEVTRETMEKVVELDVPLTVDLNTGPNLAAVKT